MKHKNTKFWYKNEKEVMKKLGLKSSPRSGAGEIIKEDGYNDYILCQLKSTEGNQIAVKRLDVEKLIYHADVDKKIPIFVLQFLDGPLLVATIADELGNISKYLNNELFEKAELIEIAEHKQKNIKKVKGKGKTSLDTIIASVKISNNKANDKTSIDDVFKRRRERNEQRKKQGKIST